MQRVAIVVSRARAREEEEEEGAKKCSQAKEGRKEGPLLPGYSCERDSSDRVILDDQRRSFTHTHTWASDSVLPFA